MFDAMVFAGGGNRCAARTDCFVAALLVMMGSLVLAAVSVDISWRRATIHLSRIDFGADDHIIPPFPF
jgi:hypothetical protein